MKRLFFLISILSCTFALSTPTAISGTTLETKDAYKGVVSIITYNADGSIRRSGVGVFIDANGTCATTYSLFEGASSADVVDYKGNKLSAHRILGASANYDLVKFSTTGGKKNEAFSLLETATAPSGASLYLLHANGDKKSLGEEVVVTKSDDYNNYKYFQTTAPNVETNFGCPLIDANGNLIAFVQQNVTSDSTSCAIDARFLNDINITTASVMSADLRNIFIPKALPANESDALTYIYMIDNNDSLTAITALNDFIAAYPNNAEGYTNRGKFFAEKQSYELCEKDFATALDKASNTESTIKADEVHNEFSKVIFQKAVYKPNPAYGDWTLTRAYQEAEKAYSISPKSFYLLQLGRCLFAEKKYQEAHEKFYQLATQKPQTDDNTWSPLAQAENWFFAARSLELAGGDSLKVLEMMDSTIAKCPKPYGQSSAQYFLERAQRLQRLGMWRLAVMDYNEYEKIIGPNNLNAQFYYIREQVELAGGMFQQALDDIRTAILRMPDDPGLKIEEAVVLLRAGLYEETITSCTALLKDFPESSDCYKLMGIAYGELGQKTEAQAALAKAKELGDTTADSYIETYK